MKLDIFDWLAADPGRHHTSVAREYMNMFGATDSRDVTDFQKTRACRDFEHVELGYMESVIPECG
jgi:hypothetical protein